MSRQPRPNSSPGRSSPTHVGSASRSVQELAGIYSARLARDWRVLYEIDDARQVVIVLDIRPRSTAYRPR